MKLTSSLRLVKPAPHTLAVACLATLLTALGLAAMWQLTDDSPRRTNAYGTSLAAGVARLTIDSLLQQDRIALGVLVNRTLELPEVAGVAVFTVDDQVLAATGAQNGDFSYSAPVTFDDAIMGYVRLILRPPTRQIPATALLLGIITLLLAPAAAVAASSVRLVGRPGAAEPGPQAAPAAVPVGTEDHHLVAINLYNQISMTREARTAELDHARAVAERVAAVYVADVRTLPGTGLLVHFAASRDPERALQVLCATFVLAELLAQHELADAGTYRLGLHTIGLPTDTELDIEAPEVGDVALLSALAKQLSVAVSDAFPLGNLRHDQVDGHLLQHPLLDELVTVPGARLVTGLSPTQQTLVTQQVERLSDQWGSMASESTF